MDQNILEQILEGNMERTDLPLETLREITDKFSRDRIIGEGGFGTVYKGVLRNGNVAVKRIASSMTIDEKLFRREVDSLMEINHQNVVRFLGFCSNTVHTTLKSPESRGYIYAEIRERLLCFEYISNGSLDKHITDELRGLEWDTRYHIIRGICAGLHYLHMEKHILHMDLKPANVLLDNQMVPKITDFGLSRSTDNSQTMSTNHFSSPGYGAPENMFGHGRMSVKSDMYSLGTIIIELVTGHKGIPDNNYYNILRRWRHRWNKSAKETPLAYQQVTECIKIGILCQEIDPYKRPFISDVMRIFDEMESMENNIRNAETPTVGQINSPYWEDDMLGVEPLELRLANSEHNNKQILSCSVELSNGTNGFIAFKIETTSPLPYSIEPNNDIVKPRSRCNVNITLPATQDHHKAVRQYKQYTEEFVVRSIKVNEGLTTKDINEGMFDRHMDNVDEVHLAVVYEEPCRKEVVQRFEELFSQTKYKEAAELAAKSPEGLLRNPETVAKFQSVPVQAGQTPPLLQYFGALLNRGKLNAYESLEFSRLAVNRNEKNLLENWLAEDKLECSEEQGDLVKTVDNGLALKIYIKAKATPKVLAAFAERRQFKKIPIYAKQAGYTPDYLFLLQTVLRTDPQRAFDFALMMSQLEGGCPLDYNTITDLFVQKNMIREATAFLLDVLKPNLEEHAFLQTKVLEINLVTYPKVADAMLANDMFSHYDRPHIAQLCEKAGLYLRAIQNYAELPSIKRVILNTHTIEPLALVEFLGTLPKEWALECMKHLLLDNLSENLQIVVNAAKEYSEQLGVDTCIKLFEKFKSYEGLYSFLGSYMISSEDPMIHFKYIESATRTGQIKEVERVTRESNLYDAENTKNFLMEAKLPDARPLINVCDRFGFVPDLIHYFYTNNLLRYIEGYVQKVNPGNAPLVVGSLLDDGCPEDFIKGLILPVCSLIPVEPLIEECEKRNRLHVLKQFLEHLVSKKGSQDVHVHNALGKIIADADC